MRGGGIISKHKASGGVSEQRLQMLHVHVLFVTLLGARHGLQQPHALVTDDELNAIQIAPTEPLGEVDPTDLVLFHPFGSAQNLTKTVLIHGNRHIFILFTPVAAQVDVIHVDIWVSSALHRTILPALNVNIGLFNSLMVADETLPPNSALVISSIRCTETLAMYISIRTPLLFS